MVLLFRSFMACMHGLGFFLGDSKAICLRPFCHSIECCLHIILGPQYLMIPRIKYLVVHISHYSYSSCSHYFFVQASAEYGLISSWSRSFVVWFLVLLAISLISIRKSLTFCTSAWTTPLPMVIFLDFMSPMITLNVRSSVKLFTKYSNCPRNLHL
jgi:hypothetical protein